MRLANKEISPKFRANSIYARLYSLGYQMSFQIAPQKTTLTPIFSALGLGTKHPYSTVQPTYGVRRKAQLRLQMWIPGRYAPHVLCTASLAYTVKYSLSLNSLLSELAFSLQIVTAQRNGLLQMDFESSTKVQYPPQSWQKSAIARKPSILAHLEIWKTYQG
jgi:hypothetical protein